MYYCLQIYVKTGLFFCCIFLNAPKNKKAFQLKANRPLANKYGGLRVQVNKFEQVHVVGRGEGSHVVWGTHVNHGNTLPKNT